MSPSSFSAQYVPDCPKAWEPFTLEHLLTHSSGIPAFTGFPDNLQHERLPTTVEATMGRPEKISRELAALLFGDGG